MAGTCPFCNARLTPSASTCPVCGERLGPGGKPAPSSPAPPKVPGKGRVLALILGGMALFALVALSYALWTQASRRANDQGGEVRPPRSPFEPPSGVVTVVPPAQLAALKYLPAELDLLVGVHFAALYQDPATRPLLDQPLPVGPMRIRLADLKAWVGLEPSALDHVVLGLSLPRGGLPRVVLVVRTRTPLDAEAARAGLQAKEVFDQGLNEKKKLWNVRLGKLDFPAVLWLADERTLVLGLSPADLADVPGEVPAGLRDLLTSRLDAGVALWSVGRPRDGLRGLAGAATAGPLDGLGASESQKKALEGLQSFAAGVVPGEEIVCRLHLELGGKAGAEQVVNLLRGPEERDNPRILCDGTAVSLQWKTTPKQLAAALPR